MHKIGVSCSSIYNFVVTDIGGDLVLGLGGRAEERPKDDRRGAQRRAGGGVWGGGCAPSPSKIF